jgi:hypothetical protein
MRELPSDAVAPVRQQLASPVCASRHASVRRRTSRRELFLVGLPRRPFAGKLGCQLLDVGLQGVDV